MDILKIRKKLDRLDGKWIKILKKRMALIPDVAKYKIKKKMKRYQPKREKEIIREKRKMAKKLGFSPNLVEDIIRRIIKESHRIEKKIMGK